ncbi:MAG: GNAT family N-acetyltransferase [Chitinophagaceae bacterium]
MEWVLKKFDDLSPKELYAILRLRSEVFVVEQDCVFLDMDNKDQLCYHFMAWQNDSLVGYTRLVPPAVSYDLPSIGRVVTSPSARNTGIGKLLIEKSIEELSNLFGQTSIRIGAQLYLKKFYESFGFIQSSDIYDEDGIDHLEMTLTRKSTK